MTSRSTNPGIGVEIIEAARRDRAWRSGLTRPVPTWFKGPHLAGLSEPDRRERFDDLSRRAVLHRGWVFAALVPVAAMVAAAYWLPSFSWAAFSFWPGTLLLLGRHDALRRQFRRDAQTFASRERSAP